MGIKGIITLLALGGILGAGYYYRNDIKEAYADAKQEVADVRDRLQDGSNGSGSSDNSNSNDDKLIDLGMTNEEHAEYMKRLQDRIESNKPQNKEPSKNDSHIIHYHHYNGNQGQSSLGKDTPKSEIIQAKTHPEIERAIQKDRKKTKSTITKHSSPYAKDNIDAYAKQKYGIDYDKLKSAKGKTPSKRTIDENKQIEAEKSLAIFDSRGINNF